MWHILDYVWRFLGNIYFRFFFLVFLFSSLTFFILKGFLPQETTVNLFQEIGVILVSFGIIFGAVQAWISSSTYQYTVTPLLLHTGFFDFFDQGTTTQNTVITQFKNVGERVCYNIQGWCINKNNFYQLIFGELIDEPEGAGKAFKADFKYTWAEKNHSISTSIMKPYIKRIEGAVDHIILFYEDNEGKAYYSLLTRSYEYVTGFLDINKISRVTNIPYRKIKELKESIKTS